MPDAWGILTKAEAFAPVEGERRIPINFAEHDFRFTNAWFDRRNLVTFSSYLPPKFPGTEPVRMIQIGAWESRDIVWQLQNTLRHQDSLLVVIDPWSAEANPKMTDEQMAVIEANARHNLSPWDCKIKIVKSYSQDILAIVNSPFLGGRFCSVSSGEWDLIVIDGDHNEEPVYQDAVNSLALLRPGGWMLFDDVRQRQSKPHHVVHGLRRFLDQHGRFVKRVWSHRFCECYEKL